MRISFFILFFSCFLCHEAWSQPQMFPLAWEVPANGAHARTQAITPYTTTLKLPYYYDFNSRYLQIDHITHGAAVNVFTLRPHGLVSGDSVDVSGALEPVVVEDFTGVKFVSRVSDYQVQLFEDKALSTATSSIEPIQYLRISKVGARETLVPDTLAFVYNQGGVQINGGSGSHQLSYYVARFDGLNENGAPYVPSTSSQIGADSIGYTDSLRSQTFDFSIYTPANNLYMSYAYQHGGFGEQPDNKDHLYLEFLDNTAQWNMVKDISGAVGKKDSFYYAMVPIDDPKYFHNAFQYRFRSYGRQSGAYDVWNLNHIYINTNRTANDTLLRDFAIRDADLSFLNYGYTAMPFKHFFTADYDSTLFFQPILNATVTLQSPVTQLKGLSISLKDQFGNIVAKNNEDETDDDVFKSKVYSDTLENIFFPVRNKAMYVDLIYSLADNVRSDLGTDAFELMFNNVLTKRTYLYDYYAYDDAGAEAGFGSSQGGIKMASQFVARRKDTLTHIDICFTRNRGNSLENSQIFLMVWGDTVSTELRKEAISIHYPSYANGFTRYALNTPVIIDSATKFHIGYMKNFAQPLALGYDRNRDSRTKSFYHDGTRWYRMTDPSVDVNDPGTMMIRPVFYKTGNNVPVGVRPSVTKNSLLLYPNPASTTIDIIATEETTELQYTMYSLTGQIVGSGTLTATDHSISVASLNTGMYLILCTDNKGISYTTRFIKE